MDLPKSQFDPDFSRESGKGPVQEKSGLSSGSPKRRLWLLLVLVLGLGLGGWIFYQWKYPALPAVVPQNLHQLEPLLRRAVTNQIAQVQQHPRDPDAHARLGLLYAVNGLWQEAEQSFRHSLRLNPDSALAAMYIGLCLQQQGKTNQALQWYQRVVQEHPDFAPAYDRLGMLLLHTGQLDQAQNLFNRLVRLAPEDWHGYAGLAEVALHRKQPQSALNWIHKALEKAPQERYLYSLLGQAEQQLGRTNQARYHLRLGTKAIRSPMLDPWAKQAPQYAKRQDELMALAQQFLQSGHPQRAIQILQSLLQNGTNNVQLLTNLGLAWNRAGQPQKALQILQTALQIDPKHLPARLALIQVLQTLGRTNEALAQAQHAVTLATNLPQPYIALAHLYLAQQKDRQALHALLQAAQRAPHSPQIWDDIGNLRLWNLHDPSGAIEAFRRAIQADDLFLPAYIHLAQAYVRAGQTNQAIHVLRQARQFVPDNPRLQALEQQLLALQQRSSPNPPHHP